MSNAFSQPFSTEADYRAAIDATLTAATREIRIFDQDLTRMAIEDPMRIEALTGFLARSRDCRLRIVLHDTAPLEQRSPRLVGLLRRFGHAIEIRRTPDHLRQLADCWVLADEAHGAIRFHADHARGKQVKDDPAEIHSWWQRFDELWEAGEACSPGAAAGL